MREHISILLAYSSMSDLQPSTSALNISVQYGSPVNVIGLRRTNPAAALINLWVIGLNTAVLSISSQNFGAKNYERIRELYLKALKFGCSFMTLAGIIIYFNASFLISLFTEDLNTISYGTIYLKIAALIGSG